MGYTTWFTGHLKFDRPLAPPHLTYLRAFNEMPHVYWDVELIKDVPDPIREAVRLPLGENGCYFRGRASEADIALPAMSIEERPIQAILVL